MLKYGRKINQDMTKESVLKDGFYEAHFRDSRELCYVRTHQIGIFASFPDGREMPVSPTPMRGEYVLQSGLSPIDPIKYFKEAQALINFIFTHLGKLADKERAKESQLARKTAG